MVNKILLGITGSGKTSRNAYGERPQTLTYSALSDDRDQSHRCQSR
jgi:hypothetical protein